VSNEVVVTSEEQINLSEPIPMPCHHHTEVAGGNDDTLSFGHGGYPDDPIAASEFTEKPFSFGIFDDLTFELQKGQLGPDHFQDHRDEEELKSIELSHNNESHSSPSTSQALDSPHPTKTSFLPHFHSPSSSAKIFTPKQQETIHRVTAGDPSLLFEMMDDHLAAGAGHDEDNVSVLTNSSRKRKKKTDEQKQRTGGAGGSRGLFMLPKRLIDQKITPGDYQRQEEGKEKNRGHLDEHSLVSLDEIYSVQYDHDQDDEDDARSKSSLTSRISRRSRANQNGKKSKNNKKKQQTVDGSYKTNVINGNRYSLVEDDDLQSVITYSSTVKPSTSSPPPHGNHANARPPPGASNPGRESVRRAPSQAQLNIHHRLNSLLGEDDEDEDSV
jgi:hypothetical protein